MAKNGQDAGLGDDAWESAISRARFKFANDASYRTTFTFRPRTGASGSMPSISYAARRSHNTTRLIIAHLTKSSTRRSWKASMARHIDGIDRQERMPGIWRTARGEKDDDEVGNGRGSNVCDVFEKKSFILYSLWSILP